MINNFLNSLVKSIINFIFIFIDIYISTVIFLREKLFYTPNIKKSKYVKKTLVINNQNKKANYSLQKNRKFDLNHFKALKSKEYVTKIIV